MVMALMTRVGTPAFSRASWRARALTTVASMPMLSATARSIPWALASRPRKMLPPPTTMPISTFRSATALISRAMARRVAGSRPNFFSPARLSPLTLSRIRRYLRGADVMGPGSGTHLEAGEPLDFEVLAPQSRAHLLEELGHGKAGVLHKGLLHQADLLIEFLQAAGDHLLDDVVRFAALFGRRFVDGLFLGDELRRNFLPAHGHR